VKCISPTVYKAVIPSLLPALTLTECAACPLDDRPPKPCGVSVRRSATASQTGLPAFRPAAT
jgi:hypothetical protein